MKTKSIFFHTLLIASVSLFASCSKDPAPNEKNYEALTTELNAYCDSVLSASGVPGIVVGVWNEANGYKFVEAKGYSNLEQKKPNQVNLHFRIGSNTKSFVITRLLQLVDEKLVNLDAKVSDYLQDIPSADSITVRMLCNMTSGYQNYTDQEEFYEVYQSDPLRKWTMRELIDLAIFKPLLFTPGTKVFYSNTNTLLVAMIIEKVTGKTWQSNVEEHVIKPLDLKYTFIPVANEYPEDAIQGYGEDEATGKHTRNVSATHDVSWGGPAGNMISTLDDMKKWVYHLTNGDLLSKELHAERFKSNVELESGVTYGLGIFNVATLWGHNGGLEGFNSSAFRDPQTGLTIIVFYNFMNGDWPTNNMVKRIYDIINKHK